MFFGLVFFFFFFDKPANVSRKAQAGSRRPGLGACPGPPVLIGMSSPGSRMLGPAGVPARLGNLLWPSLEALHASTSPSAPLPPLPLPQLMSQLSQDLMQRGLSSSFCGLTPSCSGPGWGASLEAHLWVALAAGWLGSRTGVERASVPENRGRKQKDKGAGKVLRPSPSLDHSGDSGKSTVAEDSQKNLSFFFFLLEVFNIKNRFPILSVIQKEKPKSLPAWRTPPKGLGKHGFTYESIACFSFCRRTAAVKHTPVFVRGPNLS